MNNLISRPQGLIVVIVITAISSVLGLLICSLFLMAISQSEIAFGFVLLALIGFAVSVAEAVVCVGLWQLNDWAFTMARAVYVINIALGVVTLFLSESSADVLFSLLCMAAFIWMLYYVSKNRGLSRQVERRASA